MVAEKLRAGELAFSYSFIDGMASVSMALFGIVRDGYDIVAG